MPVQRTQSHPVSRPTPPAPRAPQAPVQSAPRPVTPPRPQLATRPTPSAPSSGTASPSARSTTPTSPSAPRSTGSSATAPQPSGQGASGSRFQAPAQSAAPTPKPPTAAPAGSGTKPVAQALDLSSKPAQQAIKTSMDHLGGDASNGLKPHSVETDDLGMTHVRLDRTHNGVPVFGEQVISHLGQDGKVKDVTGDMKPLKFADGAEGAPKLSQQDAIAKASEAFKKENPNLEPGQQSDAKLVYYKGENEDAYHKAYQVQMNNFQDANNPMKMNYMVDAQSGKVLNKYNDIDAIKMPKGQGGDAATGKDAKTGAAGGPATDSKPTAAGQPGTGSSLYDGTVPLQTKKNADGTYSLEDDTRGGGKTMDANNARTDPFSGQWDHSKATDFKDKNNVWGEATDNPREKAAVDAHYGMEQTWDFYKNVLGRNSIDGKGMALNSYVHLDKNFDNAFWDGKAMQYGDGDGKQFGPLTTLDITGHEISHGLTEKTAGLVYQGQSGGLNEAMSDIMGKGVQWYAAQKNPAIKFDWGVGSQAFNPGHNDGSQALRYMNDPTKDGQSIDHVSKYNSGLDVHYSSGVANNAFYLAANGGQNRTSGMKVDKGMGMNDALKSFYRAEAYYMRPNSNFKDAASACVKAATDLYGANSQQVKAMTQAWKAVGAL